jgi:transketolase C-terminal domain/subunit
MRQELNAGIVAGGIAVTAGGGISIIADGWPEAVLVALAVGAAFGLGSWSADRRVAAVVTVVRSFCEEITSYYAARRDGEITDEEAHEIAGHVGRFVADLEALAVELCRRPPSP